MRAPVAQATCRQPAQLSAPLILMSQAYAGFLTIADAINHGTAGNFAVYINELLQRSAN